MRDVRTLVIGGGQAGLATSAVLTELGREHVVLERSTIASAWRAKWDSFHLLTPNWSVQLPGFPLRGVDPDGFLTRDETVAHLEAYARSFRAPIECGVEVTSVRPSDGAFIVKTSTGDFRAREVVVATGAYPVPQIPACSAGLSPAVMQLHTLEYRSPSQIPEGGVLVVGSAQSGFQIADELTRAGRTVTLAMGDCGWSPRRYRGRDLHAWLFDQGFMDHRPESLASPEARFACVPNIITKTPRLASFRDLQSCGIELVGRVEAVTDGRVVTAGGVENALVQADRVCEKVKALIDGWIASQGLDAPEEPPLPIGPRASNEPATLDLAERNLRTVIWATGFGYAFDFIHAPVFDARGFPRHERGVTTQDGLFFIGLPWLHKRKSSLLLGTGEDVRFLGEQLSRRA